MTVSEPSEVQGEVSNMPLIISFGVLGFCITGPVAPFVTLLAGIAFGWTAGLNYAGRALLSSTRKDERA